MVVIITNMDMPKDCLDCFHMGIYSHCALRYKKKNNYDRHPNCPLKEVNNNSVLEDIKAEIESYNSPLIGKNVVLDIIHKYCNKEQQGE